MATPSRSTSPVRPETNFQSSLTALHKYVLVPVFVEIFLVLYAVHAARSIPLGGDPTLRYVSIGIPAFWAVILAILVAAAYLLLAGQSVTLNSNAFVFRRGKFTAILRWSEIMYRPSSETSGRSFGLSTKTSHILIMRVIFPDFDRIESEVAENIKLRATAQEMIQV